MTSSGEGKKGFLGLNSAKEKQGHDFMQLAPAARGVRHDWNIEGCNVVLISNF